MRSIAIVMLAVTTALVAGCGNPTGTQPGTDAGTPKDGETDQDRVQGVWAVEKYDAGDPIAAPPKAVQETMRYIFRGNKLRSEAKSDAGSSGSSYSVVFDSASNPKILIVTPLGEDGKPFADAASKRMEWLYKFERDGLVLARSGGKRPTNFTPKAATGAPGKDDKYVPGVDIVHLKKTSDGAPGTK